MSQAYYGRLASLWPGSSRLCQCWRRPEDVINVGPLLGVLRYSPNLAKGDSLVSGVEASGTMKVEFARQLRTAKAL
jgi:hypothetical protein